MTLLLLLLYSAALIALGLWIGRSVRSTGAFFVAGRKLGPGLVFATILAANIGAGSTVGAASRSWRDGVSAWWWVGSAGLGTILLGLWLGPKLWRIAREHDLHTVGDFLELRYGAATRGIVAALLWVGTLAILGSQLMAIAWVLDVVADIPKVWGCILGGLVVTVYFYAGGLLTSAWVNLVQLAVLLFGFVLALPFALEAASTALGQTPLLDFTPTDDYWGFGRSGGSGWVYAPLLIPAFLVSPGLVQKCWGARSERAVRLGVTAAGAALLIFSLLPTFLGMAARALHPELDHPDLALPTLLTADLPAWLGLLGLAAVFSAELSSADAILFMLATSLSRDLYRRFLRPDAGDAEVLRVARRAAAAGGALGVGLALVLPDVIAGLQIFYALLGVSLLVPVLAGVLLFRDEDRPKPTPRTRNSALAAVAAGVVTLLWSRGVDVAPLTPNLVALAASALAFAIPWRLARW